MNSDTKLFDPKKERLSEKEVVSDIDESFDWDWILDREWLRTKK